MEQDPRAAGLVVVCDRQGAIVSVIRDELDAAGQLVPGQSFTSLVDRGSLSKALSFWVELGARGAAFGWEMNVAVAGQVVSLHFAGGALGDNFLIAASQTRNGARRLYEDMLLINNEQTNALRAAFKGQAETACVVVEREGALYDQISRLNNELVAMQRELAHKNAELEKLNALKNQFLGMAAHDLRNPLAVIQGYSDFLLDHATGQLGPEYVQFLQTIRSSSEFMVRLVSDLLDVSAIESGQLQLDLAPTDLAALIERNVALNRVLAEKKQIRLVFERPGELPRMLIDAYKIEQVLNNLISNAVKYSHPDSTVTVRVAPVQGRALVAVQDQGQGIPPDELGKLFQPFSRTSVQSTAGEKSTGLGLLIVRRIVEGHQGNIWVESRVGQGSTFFVSLPLPIQ